MKEEAKMIIVHHLNNSRSQRILWMLEELGVPYEVKRYQRLPSMMAPPELKAVHPLGKSPIITDGDKTLAESGAIIEYLGDTYGHGKLTPALGTPERLHYTYFLHYAEGSLMPLLFMKLVFGRIPSAPALLHASRSARRHREGANKTLLDPQIGNHFHVPRGRALRARLVRRRRLHRRRHPDELPARSRRGARADRAADAQALRLPRAHPRPAGLQAGAPSKRADPYELAK